MIKPLTQLKFFKTTVSTFHFFGVLGFICAVLLSIFLARQLALNPAIILLLSIVGAATFFALAFTAKRITGTETIVYYHHEIMIMIFSALALYLMKQPVLRYLDITLLGIGTFLGFGRIGCYSVGCCHGRPHKHGVVYGQQHVDAGFTWFYKNVPLLPVQLIESAYVFLTVIAGVFLLLHHVKPGTVVVIYTVIYGLMRFAIEYFRGDPERPLWQGLSEAQWTTLSLTGITYIISRVGWLPSYNWHCMILIVMAAAALITIYYFNRGLEHRLFSPSHIMQLATGLNLLEEADASQRSAQQGRINVYTTGAGFSVSFSTQNTNQAGVHYTISLRNKIKINPESAHKMARTISILKNCGDKYELIETQNGIYHILFAESQ
jgi:prolipoprotein diacylglyceryltransferase